MQRILAFTPHILCGLGGYFFPFTTGVILSALEPANEWKRFGRALLRVTITGLLLLWLTEAAKLGWDSFDRFDQSIYMKMMRWDWITFLLLTLGIGFVMYRQEMASNGFFAPLILSFNICSDILIILFICAGYQALTGQEISPLAVLAGVFLLLVVPVLWWYSGRLQQSASAPITAAMTPYAPLARATAFNPALHLDTSRGLCFTWEFWVQEALSNIFVPPEQREFFRWLDRFHKGPLIRAVGGPSLEDPLAQQPPVELDPDSDPLQFWRRVYVFASGMDKPDETTAGWFAQSGFMPVLTGVDSLVRHYGSFWPSGARAGQFFLTLYRWQIFQLVDDMAYTHRLEAAYGPQGPDETVAGPGETSGSDEGLLGYQGKRLPDGSVVVEAVRPNQPPRRLHPNNSRKIWIHSDHFDWGYGGHAPAQLALAIALDYSQDREQALLMYPALLFALIRGLPLDQWFIPVEDPPPAPRVMPPGLSASDQRLWRSKLGKFRERKDPRAQSLNAIWEGCEESKLEEVPPTAASLPGEPEKDLFALRPVTEE